MRIVVVEDEEKVRNGIIRLIHRLSDAYQVVGQCENGAEGLTTIKGCRPDLVVTDIRMPVMSGIDMLESLKMEGIAPRTIILSGYSEFELARKALQIGNVIEYLLKPITADDLQQVLLTAEKQMTSHLLTELSQNHPGTEFERLDPHDLRKALLETADKIAEHLAKMPKSHSLVIHKSMKIIQEKFSSGITLEELANAMCITPEYLSSLFQKELGISFTAYLKDMRMKKAKELLLRPLKSFEVAQQVGYSDAKYFTRVFKEATGLTPGEFQKLYR
ncbi:helix-turn-helix domain-containing protein [Paenibacillus sp. GCM10023248]|uniref:response regulator transcription factor n=1 Tax=unclassified Paenibacillus TaxID=185978 RepID=UPI002379EAA9|nr:helix-turn-helix domain-containing protein [Paenibacillus sp. MAHUQ-63]MDD9268363.1 response regulator [Paenibacillus sp. MAHUQ-63]